MIRSLGDKTPRIAESAFVSEMAYVVGDVEIGENTGIWPGAVVRGDFAIIKIGCNSQIEDNSVLHSGTAVEIGDNVLIGHSVVVHGKKIGNNTLIGNNATILDEAEIDGFCIIGANCLVSQGMKIPDNSLVTGVPAKIKGRVPSRQLVRLQKGTQHYIKLAQQYKEQGL